MKKEKEREAKTFCGDSSLISQYDQLNQKFN